MSVLKFKAPSANARKIKFAPFKTNDVVLVKKVGRKVVNQVLTVGEVRTYKDGTFALYHRSNEGYNQRLWSKVCRFNRIGTAKLLSLATTVADVLDKTT